MSGEKRFDYALVDDIRERFLNEVPLRPWSIGQHIRRGLQHNSHRAQHRVRFATFDLMPRWKDEAPKDDADAQERIAKVAKSTGHIVSQALVFGTGELYAREYLDEVKFKGVHADSFIEEWAEKYAHDFMLLKDSMEVVQL